jgi:hypothetical protein
MLEPLVGRDVTVSQIQMWFAVCGLQLNGRGRENEPVVHQDREMPWLNAYCVYLG